MTSLHMRKGLTERSSNHLSTNLWPSKPCVFQVVLGARSSRCRQAIGVRNALLRPISEYSRSTAHSERWRYASSTTRSFFIMTYTPISCAPLLMMDRFSLPGLESDNSALLCGGGGLHPAKLTSNTFHVFLLGSYDRRATHFICDSHLLGSVLTKTAALHRGCIQYPTWRLGPTQPLLARALHPTTSRGSSWKQARDGTTNLRMALCYRQPMAEKMLGCFWQLHL